MQAKVLACKEPIGLSCSNGKRPNGATMIPWACGRPLAWDVSVRDTFGISHIGTNSVQSDGAAETAARNKRTKYSDIIATHLFIPVVVETLGALCTSSIEVLTDLDKRISDISSDPRETAFLFQRLTIALHRGNTVVFNSTFSSATSDLFFTTAVMIVTFSYLLNF